MGAVRTTFATTLDRTYNDCAHWSLSLSPCLRAPSLPCAWHTSTRAQSTRAQSTLDTHAARACVVAALWPDAASSLLRVLPQTRDDERALISACMSVYYKILTNAATMRFGAEKMVQSNIKMTDGSPFTMQLWDTWDEEEQRKFLIAFFIQRWDSLSFAAKQAEVLKMPKECYRCGMVPPHGVMSPCAGVGYSALTCSDCALKVLLEMLISPP